MGEKFGAVSGRVRPPLGPRPGQNVAQTHGDLGTEYRPNRPSGDPFGGRFSFCTSTKSKLDVRTQCVCVCVCVLFLLLRRGRPVLISTSWFKSCLGRRNPNAPGQFPNKNRPGNSRRRNRWKINLARVTMWPLCARGPLFSEEQNT